MPDKAAAGFHHWTGTACICPQYRGDVAGCIFHSGVICLRFPARSGQSGDEQLALSALLISVIGILVLITFITAVTVTMLSRSAALRNPVGSISTE